jgi:hypothetical protein
VAAPSMGCCIWCAYSLCAEMFRSESYGVWDMTDVCFWACCWEEEEKKRGEREDLALQLYYRTGQWVCASVPGLCCSRSQATYSLFNSILSDGVASMVWHAICVHRASPL